MTGAELEHHEKLWIITLIIAGFFTFGGTWIALYIIYEDRLYDSK